MRQVTYKERLLHNLRVGSYTADSSCSVYFSFFPSFLFCPRGLSRVTDGRTRSDDTLEPVWGGKSPKCRND